MASLAAVICSTLLSDPFWPSSVCKENQYDARNYGKEWAHNKGSQGIHGLRKLLLQRRHDLLGLLQSQTLSKSVWIFKDEVSKYLLLQQILLVLIFVTLVIFQLGETLGLLLQLTVIGGLLLDEADDRGGRDLKLGARHYV